MSKVDNNSDKLRQKQSVQAQVFKKMMKIVFANQKVFTEGYMNSHVVNPLNADDQLLRIKSRIEQSSYHVAMYEKKKAEWDWLGSTLHELCFTAMESEAELISAYGELDLLIKSAESFKDAQSFLNAIQEANFVLEWVLQFDVIDDSIVIRFQESPYELAQIFEQIARTLWSQDPMYWFWQTTYWFQQHGKASFFDFLFDWCTNDKLVPKAIRKMGAQSNPWYILTSRLWEDQIDLLGAFVDHEVNIQSKMSGQVLFGAQEEIHIKANEVIVTTDSEVVQLWDLDSRNFIDVLDWVTER
jgi:hypothetical protein